VRYGLDIATTGEWGDVRLLTELAVEAENAGWDGFFVWDVFLTDDDSPVADPWVTLAAIAARTSRLNIGAMVTPLIRRQPWEIARQAASLDQLSDGRLVLGVGLGSGKREFERLGLPVDLRERARIVEERLAVIDRLWTGEVVTTSGAGFDLRGVRLAPSPIQRPRIPVWVAAGWPRLRPLRRAALWDGVYLMTNNQVSGERLTPTEVAEAVAVIRAQRTGDARPFDVAANVETLHAEDGGAQITRQMAEAGATWALELTPDTLAEHRELIRRGPPRRFMASGQEHRRAGADLA
jgi:alkanesulfonate monooxygenase SsuD/methylene tetrahydromethanopterin reductase-like flavin-dependent oxidoreductase (luciferase family)